MLKCELCGIDKGKRLYFGSSTYCQKCFRKFEKVLKLLEEGETNEAIEIMEKILDEKEAKQETNQDD